jgi:hypothetical protein
MVKHSSVGQLANDSLVAEGIPGSGRVWTIAVQECDPSSRGWRGSAEPHR